MSIYIYMSTFRMHDIYTYMSTNLIRTYICTHIYIHAQLLHLGSCIDMQTYIYIYVCMYTPSHTLHVSIQTNIYIFIANALLSRMEKGHSPWDRVAKTHSMP